MSNNPSNHKIYDFNRKKNFIMSVRPTARIITDPGEEFQVSHRYWQGCPTIERTPRDVLFAGWYSGGVMEPSPENYNLLVRSTDGGFSWSDPLLVIASDPLAGKIAIDIELWLAPDDTLWLFWVERDCKLNKYHPEHLALFAICCENPDAENLQWSEPRFITHGFLRCKPTVLSDRRWLLPAYDWCSERYNYCESVDQGRSFVRRSCGVKMNTDFDEGMFFETRDSAIHLFARSLNGVIAESVSCDGGRNWSDGAASGIISAASRLFIRRLQSGNLLLIYHNDPKKRTNLTAVLSSDDGKSWSSGLILDDSENISYPEAVQLEDGSIVMIYDHGRMTHREILSARFTEEDILQGSLIASGNSHSFLRHIISKAPVPVPEIYEPEKAAGIAWMQKTTSFWDIREKK